MSTLSYSLGADDISKIVDAILPKLSSFFPDLTKEEKYVLLHKTVLRLSKGKTFTNKDDLDTLVKDIVKKVVDEVIKSLASGLDSANAVADGEGGGKEAESDNPTTLQYVERQAYNNRLDNTIQNKNVISVETTRQEDKNDNSSQNSTVNESISQYGKIDNAIQTNLKLYGNDTFKEVAQVKQTEVTNRFGTIVDKPVGTFTNKVLETGATNNPNNKNLNAAYNINTKSEQDRAIDRYKDGKIQPTISEAITAGGLTNKTDYTNVKSEIDNNTTTLNQYSANLANETDSTALTNAKNSTFVGNALNNESNTEKAISGFAERIL